MKSIVAVGLSLVLSACASLGSDLPEESPPLLAMEEPPALHAEPDDEEARVALSLGSFTGVHVTDGRTSLSGLDDAPEGVLIQKVIENSPGDAAGLVEGDLLVAVRDVDGVERPLAWPSEWRALEDATAPGSGLDLVLDRAGRDHSATLRTAPRVRPRDRKAAERFREEERIGVVLRTATEAEARAHELGAGGGAVVVGLTRESPWRTVGLKFGDLVLSVDGAPVAHPQVLLDAIRDAEPGADLSLRVARNGDVIETVAPVSRREQEVRRVALNPLFDYGSERGESELSILLGLIRYHRTAAAWELSLFWLFTFSGGDANRLEETP